MTPPKPMTDPAKEAQKLQDQATARKLVFAHRTAVGG
jgi:hypothetical protein